VLLTNKHIFLYKCFINIKKLIVNIMRLFHI